MRKYVVIQVYEDGDTTETEVRAGSSKEAEGKLQATDGPCVAVHADRVDELARVRVLTSAIGAGRKALLTERELLARAQKQCAEAVGEALNLRGRLDRSRAEAGELALALCRARNLVPSASHR